MAPAALRAAARRPFAARLKTTLLALLILAAGALGGALLYERLAPLSGRGGGPVPAPSLSERGTTGSDAAEHPVPAPTAKPEGAGGVEAPALPPSPDAILGQVAGCLYTFVGLDAKGEEVARCAAAATEHGLALPARCLLGSELAWVNNAEGRGVEIASIRFFDLLLGVAVAAAPDGLETLPVADRAAPAIGDRVFLVRPDEKSGRPVIVPALFSGSSYDPETGAARYVQTGAAAGPLGGVVVDQEGRLLGIAPPGRDEEETAFIPAFLFDPGRRAGELTLAEFNAIYYSGSYEARVREARSLAQRGFLRDALELYESALLQDARRGDELRPEILALVLDLARSLLAAGRAADAADLAARHASRFPESVDLVTVAFQACAASGDFTAADRWMARIGRLDPELYRRLESEHVAMFLRWSEDHVAAGQRRPAAGVISSALKARPNSAMLHESLGGLLKSLRDYAGAAAAFQEAVRLDPSRGPALVPLIEMCAELQGAPGAVVIDFDPKGPIRCRGLLNGRVWVDFIVDTGASYTSIPAAAAEALGIKVDRIRDKARVTTANGEKAIPYFLLGSLDVSGLVLKESFALINDLPQPDEGLGLLGLNFLGEHHYAVDHQSGRMVLRPK